MYSRYFYRINLLSLFIFPVMLSVPGMPVSADELLMRDGSRLIGKVIRKENGVLEFKTGFAGVIRVQWTEVSELHADEPVTVVLGNDKTVMVTTINNTEETTLLGNGVEKAVNSIEPGELAYINPAPWRLGKGIHWTGRVNLDLRLQRGNTDKDEFDADAELGMRRIHDRYTVYAQFEKDSNAGTLTNQKWKLNNKYDYFLNKKLYYGGTLTFEHNRFADLVLRTAVGPHIGYQLFESTVKNLNADIGVLYVDGNFDESPDENYMSLGWQANYDHFLIPARVQFYHRHTGLLDLGNGENLTVSSWTGFRFPLYMGIVASTEAEVRFDGSVPADVDKTDTTYRVKIGYQW